jgi:leader peptidase (prepilin peptidase)/N-methyltransferase
LHHVTSSESAQRTPRQSPPVVGEPGGNAGVAGRGDDPGPTAGAAPAPSQPAPRRWTWLAGLAVTPAMRAAVIFLSVPAGESGCRECPGCRAPLLYPWRSVAFSPVGRCHRCRAQLGAPPFLLEAAVVMTATLLLLSHRRGWELLGFAWFSAAGITAAFVDLRVRRLPNLLTAAAGAGLLAAFAVAAVVDHRGGQLVRAVVAGVVLMLAMAVLALLRPGALGGGDVKLGFSIGLVLGWISWFAVYAGITAGFALAMVYALAMLITRRAKRRGQFALGPFLVAGTLLTAALLG